MNRHEGCLSCAEGLRTREWMRDDEGEKLKEPVPLDMPLKVVLHTLMKLPCGVIHLASSV